MLEPALRTGTRCPVSASAITDPKVGAELVVAGFKGLLIGTGLLRSGSVQSWVDEFEQHRAALGSAAPPHAGIGMTETIFDHFAAHARARPEAPALIWEGEAISYGELAEMTATAHAEVEAAELPEERARRHPRAEVAGGDRADPRLPRGAASLPAAVGRAGARDAGQALRAGGRQPRARAARPAERERKPARNRGGACRGDEEPSQWPPAAGGDDISFMLTTSGSTGLPKVVPLPAGGVDRFTDWAASQFDIGPGTVVANYAPLNFDLCLLDIWTTLKHGGCVALVDQDRATQGAYLADLITANEVNVLQAVPMLYRLLIDVTREDGRRFPSIRHAITTGDKIPATSLEALPGLFPNARFFNIYGCTETNDSLIHEFEGLADGEVPTNVPVGQPLPGVQTLIRTDDGAFLEGTGTGELLVWTPFQTRGYLNAALNEGTIRLASRRRRRRDDLLPHG